MRVVFCILLCIVVNRCCHGIVSDSDSEENEISDSDQDISSQNSVRRGFSEEKDDTTKHVKLNMSFRHERKKSKSKHNKPKIAEDEINEYLNYSEDNDGKHFKNPHINALENKPVTRDSDNTNHLSSNSGTSCPNSKSLYNKKDPASGTHSYPFVVSILRKGSHYATGALLDRNWILTCAGEFYNVRESIKLMRVRLGTVDNKHGGTVVPLKGIVIHPFYVSEEPNFDLAMLKLAEPIQYNQFIKPICITNFKSKVIGGKFLTTYWPRLIVKGEPLPTTASERVRHTSLRVSTQKMIPPEKCHQQLHSTNITLDASTLCLKHFSKHHSSCVPDAGAPVIGEDGLWGIVSGWTSPDCLQKPSPYMFTRLSSQQVQTWLDKILKDDHS